MAKADEPPDRGIKIISETSAEEIAEHRARDGLDYPLRDLTANLIRIARGAGKPHELGQQLTSVVQALVEYREATGAFPDNFTISEILSVWETRDLDTWRASFRHGVSEDDISRWLEDGSFDRSRFFDEIVRASLQVAASRLLGQRTQESTAESQLYARIDQLEAAREQRRLAHQVSTRRGRRGQTDSR